MSKLMNFLRNLKFLFTHNIHDEMRENMYQTLLRADDLIKYEHKLGNQDIFIYDSKQTLDLLLSNPKSFIRLGDGEINLINGISISFQKYDERLANYLKLILESSDDNFYIGLNYNYFNSTENLCLYNKKFYYVDSYPIKHYIIEHCNKNNKFISAAFNQMYILETNDELTEYYEKIKMLFYKKDIVLFCGKGIIEKCEYNIFEYSSSFILEEGPNCDSFSCFDDLLLRAKKYDKNKLMCFILGPTSKALIYELSQIGYLCYDLGHLSKDYDFFMKKTEKTSDKIKGFYDPD